MRNTHLVAKQLVYESIRLQAKFALATEKLVEACLELESVRARSRGTRLSRLRPAPFSPLPPPLDLRARISRLRRNVHA